MTTRRGFTIVEVLIAVCILAFCAIPIVTMIQSGTHKAHFNEYHLSAQVQARWVADAVQSLDYQYVRDRANASSTTAKGLPGLDDEKLREVGNPLPPLRDLMAPYFALEPKHQPFLEHAVGRFEWFRRRVFFEEVAPGLGHLVIYVDWTLPSDSRGTRHHYVYRRLIARPEISMMSNEKIEKS